MTVRLITFPQLESEFGITFCRMHVSRMVKAGKFPAPFRPTGSRIFWDVQDITNWLNAVKKEAAQ